MVKVVGTVNYILSGTILFYAVTMRWRSMDAVALLAGKGREWKKALAHLPNRAMNAIVNRTPVAKAPEKFVSKQNRLLIVAIQNHLLSIKIS